MKTTAPLDTSARFTRVGLATGVSLFLVASQAGALADEGSPAPEKEAPKKNVDAPTKPVVKGERPPGGDGSMFFKVFVSRNDRNNDGVIDKSEFRGGGDRFDQMDKNKNGKLDRSEIDELHRSRMADPLSMRQRIARGETRRPPVDFPAAPESLPKAGDDIGADDEPSALTPMGTGSRRSRRMRDSTLIRMGRSTRRSSRGARGWPTRRRLSRLWQRLIAMATALSRSTNSTRCLPSATRSSRAQRQIQRIRLEEKSRAGSHVRLILQLSRSC